MEKYDNDAPSSVRGTGGEFDDDNFNDINFIMKKQAVRPHHYRKQSNNQSVASNDLFNDIKAIAGLKRKGVWL